MYDELAEYNTGTDLAELRGSTLNLFERWDAGECESHEFMGALEYLDVGFGELAEKLQAQLDEVKEWRGTLYDRASHG